MVLAGQNALDPAGVELRRRHALHRRVYRNPGPNFALHLDGYDKIKSFGFAIHGAIDGCVIIHVILFSTDTQISPRDYV